MPFARRLVLGLLLLVPASAQSLSGGSAVPTPAPDAVVDLHPVVVTGVRPGPGMWRVLNGHRELWILGTLQPVPADVEWSADQVREVLETADEVLWPPYYAVAVDAGFFGKLKLGYRMARASSNPGGRSLEDTLPPEVHARWRRAKARYLGGGARVESKRPGIAAETLFQAAVERSGLTMQPLVNRPILEVVRRRGIPSLAPSTRIRLDRATANRMLKDVRHLGLDDVECMVATLDVVEHALPRMVANANAWATGELGDISLSHLQRREAACADAFTNNRVAAEYGLPDIRSSIAGRWLEEATRALTTNDSTLSVVPLGDLTGPGGYLEALRARGYRIEMPH